MVLAWLSLALPLALEQVLETALVLLLALALELALAPAWGLVWASQSSHHCSNQASRLLRLDSNLLPAPCIVYRRCMHLALKPNSAPLTLAMELEQEEIPS